MTLVNLVLQRGANPSGNSRLVASPMALHFSPDWISDRALKSICSHFRLLQTQLISLGNVALSHELHLRPEERNEERGRHPFPCRTQAAWEAPLSFLNGSTCSAKLSAHIMLDAIRGNLWVLFILLSWFYVHHGVTS